MILVSKEYADRMWTIHERRSAQERALRERGAEYIIPIKFDDTQLPGLSTLLGYVSSSKGTRKIAKLVGAKIWCDPSAPKHFIDSNRYDEDD